MTGSNVGNTHTGISAPIKTADYLRQINNNISDDAFGRVQVSNPFGQFEVTHVDKPIADLYVGETSDSTGTVSALNDEAAAQLSCDAGEIIKRQSHAYIPYQPGKSRDVKITSYWGTHVAGSINLIGYGDDDDGPFLGRDDTGVFILLRSSTQDDIKVYRHGEDGGDGWNIDRLDGTGPSGIIYDNDNFGESPVHFDVDLQWLAVGRVRWRMEVDGRSIQIHEYDSTQDMGLTGAYMRTGSLPVRWELDNTGGSSTATMKAICAAATSDGGRDAIGQDWAVTSGSAGKSVSGATGTRTPILSVRPKATFDSKTNHGVIYPGKFSVVSDNNIYIEAVIGGTLGSASFSSVNAVSRSERDISATTITGGRIVAGQAISGGKGGSFGSLSAVLGRNPTISLLADGTQQPITLVATRLSADSSVYATLEFRESL